MFVTFTWATNSGFEEETFVINVLGLVVLLIFLAGVTAYAGDRLGMFVARRRLSLFGIRPRRTGQIVGSCCRNSDYVDYSWCIVPCFSWCYSDNY